MTTIGLPILPASIWLLISTLTILLLFVVLGFYIYWRRRQAALIIDIDDVASLAARKQILQAEMENIRQWMTEQKSEIERLTAEREDQERLRAHLADLEQQCATRDQENQALRNEVGELENQRHNISQTLEKLEREIGDLNAKRAEAQTIDVHLAELRNKLEDAQESVRSLSEVQAKLAAFSAEKISLERTLKDLDAEVESVLTAATQHKKQAEQTRAEVEEAALDLARARKERAEVGIIVDTLRQEQNSLEREVEHQERKIDELDLLAQTAREKAERNTAYAEEANAKAEESGRELSEMQRGRQRLELEAIELNTKKAAIEQEIGRLEGRLGGRAGGDEDPLAAYADLLEKQPSCLTKNEFDEEREKKDETFMLQYLRNTLKEEGLIFSSRVIDAFHTSLKCHDITPITVLAGVSGTGKTLLPIRYAEIMGMHRLVMAVQPRWDSPQDMFGFYNYLEKEYKATELSRALVRMDPYNYLEKEFSMLDSNWTKERLLLVLLDEMNLARTEYYFSEFLSKLELQRMVKDPSVAHNRRQAEVELDVGPSKYSFRLWVESNVFFVGTLNEDETTQTLSDKVLDRANVIRFGKPDEKAKAAGANTQTQAGSDKKYLSISQWHDWHQKIDEGVGWYEQVFEWTRRLNTALDRVGRPFGFRVQQAIGRYVSNYPRIDDAERYKLAFADQVELKIIPKLRGIDIDNNNANECLSELEAVIDELGDDELSGTFDTARNESETLGMFQWRGVSRRGDEENI